MLLQKGNKHVIFIILATLIKDMSINIFARGRNDPYLIDDPIIDQLYWPSKACNRDTHFPSAKTSQL